MSSSFEEEIFNMATAATQSAFVANENWQSGKSVTECNLHMLKTEKFTDITFLVGSEKHIVRAHSYVLASRSCVFYTMLCSRLPQRREITISDIEVNVFRDFLRFLYTDSCTINSRNVSGLLYASKKYDVETLLSMAASFLEESLSDENLCEILEESHGYGETDVEHEALKMLSNAGPGVTKSEGFLKLCSRCFGTFLKSRNLNIAEEKIFDAVLSWTAAKCAREALTLNHEDMRKVLGEMVYEIRFASLSLEFMVKVVGPSGILTANERVKIMDSILESSNDISPFKSDPRGYKIKAEKNCSTGFHYVQRFRKIFGPSYQGQKHAISFSANKQIILLGCQLFGSGRELRTRLSIQLYDDLENLIFEPLRNTDCSLSHAVNDVLFTNPVLIQIGHVYTIRVEPCFCVHEPLQWFRRCFSGVCRWCRVHLRQT